MTEEKDTDDTLTNLLKKNNEFVKNHRKIIGLFFIIIIISLSFYTFHHREHLFKKVIMYNRNGGTYLCNETYNIFGKLISDKCILPKNKEPLFDMVLNYPYKFSPDIENLSFT
jgi:hypothetical protein